MTALIQTLTCQLECISLKQKPFFLAVNSINIQEYSQFLYAQQHFNNDKTEEIA